MFELFYLLVETDRVVQKYHNFLVLWYWLCTGINKVRLFFSGQVPRGEDTALVHVIHSDKWTSVHTQRIVGV